MRFAHAAQTPPHHPLHPQHAAMSAFYGGSLGLPLVTDEDGFKEFDAGGCRIALHNGASEIGARPPKLVFYADDVAATREALMARGVKLGKVLSQAGCALRRQGP